MESTLVERGTSFVGIAAFVALAYALSSNRREVNWRVVATGLALQFAIGILVLKVEAGRAAFSFVAGGFEALMGFTRAGSEFVFGRWPNVMQVTDATNGQPWVLGFNLAFLVLPTVIFVSSLFSVLYHLGALQRIVKAFAWLMARVMRLSGAESLAAAANVFMGMTEAPLMVAPYLARMTTSELMAVMTSGMATIAGGVMVAYIGMGGDATHLLCASVMSAPAALVVAKIMVPEIETPETLGSVNAPIERIDVNVFDAAARGAEQGTRLAINVAGMLIAFIALLAMVNAIFGGVGALLGKLIANESYRIELLADALLDANGAVPLTLEALFGVAGFPVAVAMGVPLADCFEVGQLVGLKTAANEFIAYQRLASMNAAGAISERSSTLATYALCGFANFGSLAIILGGMGVLVPERRGDLAKLGVRSIVAGSLACFLTACVAGVLA